MNSTGAVVMARVRMQRDLHLAGFGRGHGLPHETCDRSRVKRLAQKLEIRGFGQPGFPHSESLPKTACAFHATLTRVVPMGGTVTQGGPHVD